MSFWPYLKNIVFKKKTTTDTVWATFAKFWAAFYSNYLFTLIVDVSSNISGVRLPIYRKSEFKISKLRALE